MEGIRGSSNSGSFSLHRNRSVEPRMNSLGCCRSCTTGKPPMWILPACYEVFFTTHFSISVTNQNHFMEQLSITTSFGPDLPKYEQQFLDLMIVTRQQEAYDGHKQPWQPLSIQHHLNHFLQSGCLPTIVTVLCMIQP